MDGAESFFGKVTNDKNRSLADLSWREIGLMVPLLFLMVYMGVYPRPILSRSEESVKAIHERVMGRAGGTVEPLVEVSDCGCETP